MATSKPIFCRLVFQEFDRGLIKEFVNPNWKYNHLRNLTFNDPVTLDPNVQNSETECQLSFTLTTDGKHEQRYQKTCLAVAELNYQFEQRREYFVHIRLISQYATVKLTILSHDVYPRHFQLQNVFCMERFGLGSIVHKRRFAPSFEFKEPKNDQSEQQVFASYLDEQRDHIMKEDLKSRMLLFFEHDRSMFTICFPNILKKVTAKEGRSKNRVVDLRVPYSSIQRIIATPKYVKDTGQYEVIFTFQVSSPPSIFIYEQQPKSNDTRTTFKPPMRFLTFNPGLDIQNCVASASCLIAKCRKVDTKSLMNCFDRIQKSINSVVEFRFLEWRKKFHIKCYKDQYSKTLATPEFQKLKESKYFPLVYAIEALISRGGEIYEYFFRPEQGFKCFTSFLRLAIKSFDNDLLNDPGASVTKTVVALENMLTEIDKCLDIPEPEMFFQQMMKSCPYQTVDSVVKEIQRDGYMRVRKIIITPTRRIFLNPEMIMGNRSLRKEGADSMLRVVFRDDDYRKVSGLPNALIESTVTEPMTKTLNVGLRQFSYLCSSNSQLRDHGTYFYAGTPEAAMKFLNGCGKFKVEAIPKMMSRMGQCFTQARKLDIEIMRESYSDVVDYTGGQDSNRKPYTFSDGVGMMSSEFRDKVAKDLKLGDCRPSCFQIRFRGYKGIVVVNPILDETKEFAIKLGKNLVYEKSKQFPWYAQSLLLRPSQKKFNGPREKFVEIVKISAPIPVSLNKPLINILDQVSEKHGPDSHNRMRNRISQLMENHIASFIKSLIEEHHAFLALNEFPKNILFDKLGTFNITEEPFFRSMLRSSALVALNKLVDKMHIRIPTSEGRMAFGVVDESGILQYGQVFFQYTTNAAIKFPGRHADKKVHTGPIMITKNPSVVAGDVRMFEAVDLPCLHDLVDVVVFPQSGPRPHPDEMAGSDLDGDEYSIFWDSQLFLDRNEDAFDFTPTPAEAPSETKEEVMANLSALMIACFTNYVSQDSIGTIANAHLANSDLYGLNSQHCHQIALKHNQAVDFSKTGQVPKSLRKEWDDQIPPERVEKFPNFMSKSSSSSYKSVRLLGSLHNRASEIKEIIRVEELAGFEEEIKMDESVLMADDQAYEEKAKAAYGEYRTFINGLLHTYGISNEGQLFSGRFFSLKKRISDKNDDDMAFYNTQHMIQMQVEKIFAKFRGNFFENIDSVLDGNGDDDREILHRVCEMPGLELRKKASAYYRIAYSNGECLSFAWIVADILSFNRKTYLMKLENFQATSLFPLEDSLSTYINGICSGDFKQEFEEYKNRLAESLMTKNSNQFVVAKKCQTFFGLNKLLFFIRKWIKKHDIKMIQPESMDKIVCMHGMGELKKGEHAWLAVYEDDSINLEEKNGGLGKLFWNFIKTLMTRNFGFSGKISLKVVGEEEAEEYLEADQCLALYYAAEETFYPIAVNRRFSCLPGTSTQKPFNTTTEGETFVVELPQCAENEKKLFLTLAIKCGCTYVDIQRKPVQLNAKTVRIAVKPVGTFIAVRKFKSFLEVSPQMNEKDLQKRKDMICEEIYRRLLAQAIPPPVPKRSAIRTLKV